MSMDVNGRNVLPDDFFGPLRKQLQGHDVTTHAVSHGCLLCNLCFSWSFLRLFFWN